MTLRLVLVFIAISCLDTTGALRCRQCSNALSLDDCSRSVNCGPNEECYLDQMATEQLTIIYNGGCRAKDVCQIMQGAGSPIGRRDINSDKRSGDRVVCSHCCNVNPINGLECNARMCGIKSSSSSMNQCYACDSSKSSGQGDVDEPTKCGTISSCQPDELCGVQQFAMANNYTYRFTCLNRRICTLLTERVLQDMKRCKDPAIVAAGGCGNVKRSGQQICTVCCADPLCNSGSCLQVLDRLYNLWMAGLLDINTLHVRNMNTPITG